MGKQTVETTLCSSWGRESVSRYQLTWPVAHDRQLFIPICVHCDEILRVSVQHQPPAGTVTDCSENLFFINV